MDQFKIYQDALETMYPSLTVFSDLSWDEISQEFLVSHDERPTDLEEFVFNFPQFLQDKASEGDCPSYLFELAFFELMQEQLINSEIEPPAENGIYLNPTLSFLNLEHDVKLMMAEAQKGNIQIILRPHVMCMYLHPESGLSHVDISSEYLEVLTLLENHKKIPLQKKPVLDELIKLGLVIDIN